jgi:hypothetical protein
MAGACATASFGSCGQVRHGATCRRAVGLTRLATIASFAGDGRASWGGIMNALATTHDAAVPPRGAFGPTSRQDPIAASRSALARIPAVPGIWSKGSSIRSSDVGASRRAMTSSQPMTSPSSSSHQYGYGCALMSPRPNPAHGSPRGNGAIGGGRSEPIRNRWR